MRLKLSLALLVALSGSAILYRWHRSSAPARELRVLCHEGWLSPVRLDQFARRRDVHVQLFTFADAAEYVRQLANADGRLDVICTSSFLLRSLARTQWLKHVDYRSLKNAREIGADFLQLPYDPRAEFAVPLYWQQYVWFAPKSVKSLDALKNAPRVWAEPLYMFSLVAASARESSDKPKAELAALKLLVARAVAPGPAVEPEDLLRGADAAEVPLGVVAAYLGEPSAYQIGLPAAGAAMELGLLAIGSKSTESRLAFDLIDDLIAPENAGAVHAQIPRGFVHRAFVNDGSVSPWRRPGALRQLPLTRLRFPDLEFDQLPRFERDLKTLAAGHQVDHRASGE